MKSGKSSAGQCEHHSTTMKNRALLMNDLYMKYYLTYFRPIVVTATSFKYSLDASLSRTFPLKRVYIKILYFIIKEN